MPLPGEIQTLDVINATSVAFDVEAFDEAIRAHGVRFVHWRAMTNPVGMIDRFDSRRPDADHSGSSNGSTFTKAGCFTGLFTSNSKELRQGEGFQLNSASASLTAPRTYDCSPEPIYLSPGDRLFLEEESVLVRSAQLVEAHETGTDRLRFPVIRVLDVVDAAGIRYQQDVDFTVCDGKVQWTGTNRPGSNLPAGTGRVYAAAYLYRPYWYVERMLHEIRVAQVEDKLTGARRTVQMPQAAVITREHVFENEQKDEMAPDPESLRQLEGPRDGSFGPR